MRGRTQRPQWRGLVRRSTQVGPHSDRLYVPTQVRREHRRAVGVYAHFVAALADTLLALLRGPAPVEALAAGGLVALEEVARAERARIFPWGKLQSAAVCLQRARPTYCRVSDRGSRTHPLNRATREGGGEIVRHRHPLPGCRRPRRRASRHPA